MSNTTKDITTLVPDLPHIVVTEASPLSTTSNSVAVGTSVSSMDPTATTTTTATSAGVGNGTVTNDSVTSEPKESTGEFQPADDCSQCVVSMDQTPPVDNTHETNEEETDSSQSQEQSAEVRSNVRRSWCPAYGGIRGFYYHASETLVDSVYLLPIQVLLLAFPVSAAFMGAKHIDECPMSAVTPFLMFIMGIAGTIIVLCRILQVFKKNLLPTSADWWWPRVIILFSGLILILCICLEATTLFRYSPNFNPTHPEYCNETFYNFTYWANWAMLMIFIMVFFLYYPICATERPANDYRAAS